MPALTNEQINALLKLEEKKQLRKAAQGKERPIQIGPLRYMEKDDKCASRGCSGPSRIQVKGVPYCSSHALYALNELYMKLEGKYEFDDCVCNAGRHSKHNVHTTDCPVFQRLKERDDSSSSSTSTTTS